MHIIYKKAAGGVRAENAKKRGNGSSKCEVVGQTSPDQLLIYS